jgi:cholesterol transport system auxiliary component
MNRARGELEVRHLERVPTGREEAARGAARRAVFIGAALMIGLFSGCRAARPSRYYQLTVPSDAGAVEKADAVPVTLLLGQLMTSHLYREDRIVYGNGAEQLGTYEYQRWAEPPTEMIQEVLLRELRSSGRYRAVHYRRSNMKGDFALRGNLYDFKEVDGGQMSARVTLEFEMRDLKSGATVWTYYYSHDEPASEKGVPALVTALDKNVQRGVKEVVESLDQYFASHPVK